MAILFRLISSFSVVSLMLLAAGPAFSQPGEGENAFGALPDDFGDFGIGDGELTQDPVQVEGFVVPARGKEPALLAVRAKVASGWHIYSLTQQEPLAATTIAIEESGHVEFLDGFRPLEKPKISPPDEFMPVLMEEHYGQVTWTAPIRFANGVNAKNAEIKGELKKGQACKDVCIEFAEMDTSFTATLGTAEQIASVRPEAPKEVGEFHDTGSKVVVRGHIEPQVVAPGETAKLVLTIEPEEGWHAYERTDSTKGIKGYKPTLIPLVKTSGLLPQTPVADKEVTFKKGTRYHKGATTWTIDFPIAQATAAGKYELEGHLAYLICSDTAGCLRPSGLQFRGIVEVGAKRTDGSLPLGFDKSSYAKAEQALGNRIEWQGSDNSVAPKIDFWPHVFGQFGFKKMESGDWGRFPGKLSPKTGEPQWDMTFSRMQLIWLCGGLCFFASFAAGLILNVMPCVLPVVGLKIMSFAQQGGESRMRVFTLNLWYSLGLLAVFLVMATFAAALHMLGQTMAWGEHLGDPRFAVPMLALVFVLGLSMFGVWEIPIPGFAGSGAASELASKEGPLGAFFKGVLTTILATPCGGPFLGIAVGIAVIAPIWLNYTMFTCMAIGMATPYLIIGAFPKLIGFIPKPGPWMDTFKQFMGFVLMATAVWIISSLDKTYALAALAMMVGLGIVCWMIGRIPVTATGMQKARRYATSAAATALSVYIFFWMIPVHQPVHQLDWQEFSRASLDEKIEQGHVVLVDFTADW